jgi:mono/diheme cytochrome c family protein
VTRSAGPAAGAALALLGILLAAGATVAWLGLRDSGAGPLADAPDDAALVDRGAYLARVGNCQGCHTARGGAPYAGGRPVATPFGTVYSANLTPDVATGLGAWRAEDLRRALHEGRSRDGRLLVPACPFDRFTLTTDADVAALHAHLRRVPAVAQANRPPALHLAVRTQVALLVWRALYFRAGRFEPDPNRPEDWNRGAYLVRGLGHCAACHAARNRLGAAVDADALRGGLMPDGRWYAPALGPAGDAPDSDALARLLVAGRTERAVLLGPMAEIAQHSTQHLSAADAGAIAAHLAALPAQPAAEPPATPADGASLERGARLYQRHCADCHGDDGLGHPGAILPLAANRAVLQQPPANLVQVVLDGAFSASTRANPRPFGMPPFAQELDAQAVADVLSHVRQAWGNRAPPVSALEVERYRGNIRD